MNTSLIVTRIATLAGLTAIVLISPPAIAAGSAERGESIAITCAACHGQGGVSANPAWPNLAGQHEKYIVDTLKAYRDGDRQDVLMTGQAAALSDEDIDDLAAFFATLPPAELTTDPALISAGERLYRGGNRTTGISACIACHGPRGHGVLPAGYPWVSGQHSAYIEYQLRAYANDSRKSDDSQVMRNIAALLTEDEIVAVSAYIQGLR